MAETTTINLPQVVAEVSAAFEDYERALVANELSTLDAYFWEAPHTVRYGVAENLYGADAIAAYRRSCRPVGSGRRLRNTVITTFGKDYATVSTEFEDGETPRIGRQMQTWVRFEEQWKVVAAHVSIDLSTIAKIPANKKPRLDRDGVLVKVPDDDLLSHGEAPHYHRR